MTKQGSLAEKSNREDMAEVFSSMGVKNTVVKLGCKGCYVKPENEKGFYAPSFENAKVMDTSGAGDSFCAGFITGLAKGWDYRSCATFANAVGTHCVIEIGTTKGIKSLAEIASFIEKNKQVGHVLRIPASKGY
jgi:sugar/nucleoside kinase (ribokinase family)